MRERDTDVVTEEFRAAALQKAKGNYQMTQLHQSRESTQRSHILLEKYLHSHAHCCSSHNVR